MWTYISLGLVVAVLLAALSIGRWAIPATLFLLALGARVDLFITGNLYGSTAEWASNIVCVALGFWAVVAYAAQKSESLETSLGVVGAALAIPVALTGVVALLAPVTPATATAPACAGASVAGGKFRATTPSTGVNARSGPDVSYPQVGRFAANCTLSFDGYCIGEPVKDLLIRAYSDQRWLILHRRWQTPPWENVPWGAAPYAFVASGTVQSQSPERELGEGPAKVCESHGGWKAPTKLSIGAPIIKQGVVHIEAKAPGAGIIGIGIMSSARPKNGSDPVFSLSEWAPTLTNSSGTIEASWNAQFSGPAIGVATTFTLIASVCLGPAVIDPNNYHIQQFMWNGKTISAKRTQQDVINSSEALRLQTAACSIAPNYTEKKETKSSK